MNCVTNSLILTSVIYMCDVFSSGKKSLSKYLFYFLLILGITYAFKVNAQEFESYPTFQEKWDKELLLRNYSEQYDDTIDPDECMFEKSRLHAIHGKKLFKMAQSIVWYLPTSDENEMAKSAFITAMSGMPNASITGKICTMTLTYLTQYGLDCMDKYKLVNNYLHRAEYHFAMHEFYEEVMEQQLTKGYVVLHIHVDEDGNPTEQQHE